MASIAGYTAAEEGEEEEGGFSRPQAMDLFWTRAIEKTHLILCIDPTRKKLPLSPHLTSPASTHYAAPPDSATPWGNSLQLAFRCCPALLCSLTPHSVGRWDPSFLFAFAVAEMQEAGGLPLQMAETVSHAACRIFEEALTAEAEEESGEEGRGEGVSQLEFIRMVREWHVIAAARRREMAGAGKRISEGLQLVTELADRVRLVVRERGDEEQRVGQLSLDLEVLGRRMEARLELGGECGELAVEMGAMEGELAAKRARFERLTLEQRHLQQLMGQLRPLADRWELRLEKVEKENGRVVGDAMLTAAFTILGCRLPPRLRRRLTAAWEAILCELQVEHTPGLQVHALLTTPAQLRAWRSLGLPQCDDLVAAASVMLCRPRPVLLLDPHALLTDWLRKAIPSLHADAEGVHTCRPTDVRSAFELAVYAEGGKVLLMTRVEELRGKALPSQWEEMLREQPLPSWHPKFRLIMSSASVRALLPRRQLKFVLVINCEPTEESVQMQVS